MSLTNYNELCNAVATWLHRDDLSASIPDFVALAEARLNRHLRMRQQMTTDTLAAVAGTATIVLPTDWLQTHRLRLVSPDKPIEFLTGALFEAKYRAADTGAPSHFTVEGASLVLGPKPDAAYSIDAVYFASIPALSASASSNWLLTAHPGLYLFAALAESAPFIGQDQRLAMWEAKYAAELQSAMDADRKARASGSALRIRAR